MTARQNEVLAMIRAFIGAHGYSPTSREIQRHFGFASQTGAMNHLRALRKHGAIEYQDGLARTITIP